MADEPDSMILRPLREIRETQDEHSERFAAVDRQLAEMRESIEKVQNTAFWGLGRSEWANVRNTEHLDRLTALEEKSKRTDDRLDALEAADEGSA